MWSIIQAHLKAIGHVLNILGSIALLIVGSIVLADMILDL